MKKNDKKKQAEVGSEVAEDLPKCECAQDECKCKENCDKPCEEKESKETPKTILTIEELMEQNTALNDKVLRQMAEFENFKRRTAKEKDDMFAFAKINCISEFLTVIDNFERALVVETADEGYKKGMQMIFNQYLDILKKLGVSEIEAQGQKFDPNLHNAVNQVEDDNYEENTVCQVFQKGYILGEKVLRHSMVVVANP